jgi:CRP-like cAMP-binding protein
MTSTAKADHPRVAWAASLGAAPVLRHLAEDERLRLIEDGTLEDYRDGAELIRADERSSAVFLLVDGACDVLRTDQTVRLSAPALVGEIAALTGTPRTATVRAAGAARAVVITRDRFLDAIRTSAAPGRR